MPRRRETYVLSENRRRNCGAERRSRSFSSARHARIELTSILPWPGDTSWRMPSCQTDTSCTRSSYSIRTERSQGPWPYTQGPHWYAGQDRPPPGISTRSDPKRRRVGRQSECDEARSTSHRTDTPGTHLKLICPPDIVKVLQRDLSLDPSSFEIILFRAIPLALRGLRGETE